MVEVLLLFYMHTVHIKVTMKKRQDFDHMIICGFFILNRADVPINKYNFQ